jgi:multidrug efflux pump subunit AcrA (membrane-fusion protein)
MLRRLAMQGQRAVPSASSRARSGVACGIVTLALLACAACGEGQAAGRDAVPRPDAGAAATPSAPAPAPSTGAAGRLAVPTNAPAVARHGDFERELLLNGELESVRSISVNTPQTSVFQMRISWMAKEGAMVKKGEPVLAFDNAALADRVLDLETQILDAETQVLSKQSEIASALKDLEIELAQKQYDADRARIDASVDAEVLSRKAYGDRQLADGKAKRELEETGRRIEATRERGQAELDVLLINRDKLRKDLESAQEDLGLLSVAAPAEGLVIYEKRDGSSSRYQEGDSCWPGQPVMRLPDLSAMQVAFSVNEVDAHLLSVGQTVRITLDSFPERELSGTIERIPSMTVNRSETSAVHVFRVISTLSETWPEAMKPGMSVLGRVIVERRANAPLVARSAVRQDGERYWMRAADDRRDAPEVEVHPVDRNSGWYVLDEKQDAAVFASGGL